MVTTIREQNDISPSGINKWSALKSLGIKENAFIAFGNDANDIPMFEKALHTVMIGYHEHLANRYSIIGRLSTVCFSTVFNVFYDNKNGEEVFINMMMDEIHFFDKETEKNIGYPTTIIAKKNAASGIEINEENKKIVAL